MLKVLKLNKQKEIKMNELEEVKTQLVEIEERSAEVEKSINEAQTREDLALFEEKINEIEAEKKELAERQAQFENDIANIEKEIAEYNERSEHMNQQTTKKQDDGEIREGINRYVKSKGAERAFKIVDGGALVPKEVLQAYVVESDTTDLKSKVKTVKVNSKSGTYPVISHTNNRLNTVTELEKNPELQNPKITNVNYDVNTYRGFVPLSQEVIDDADYDVVGLIADEINNQAFNTTNHAIAEVLKQATAKKVTNLDEIKKVLNVDVKKRYNTVIIMSASMYNALDTLKDKEGRYLLQDDISAPSGKSLLGKPVEVLDDDVIGNKANDMVAFVGDANAYCTFFDRAQTTVKWVDHNVYGQLLAVFTRFDVQKIDAEAGFYITYTPGASA